MGGDCSQKLLLRRGWHSSPGRSRSSDQYAIHNSIAKMVPADSSFSRRLFFSAYSGADVSLPWDLSFPEPVLFSYCRSVSIFSLKPVPPQPVSGRRHRTLAAWSPPVRRNGALPRRR